MYFVLNQSVNMSSPISKPNDTIQRQYLKLKNEATAFFWNRFDF